MESWIQIDAIYLYQFGNLSAVPGGLNFGTTQVTMPINTPQILIIKKRDNSGYVKIALNGGFISPGGNIISMVYAMSSGTSFPLSFD
jgi:hypothetical protein